MPFTYSSTRRLETFLCHWGPRVCLSCFEQFYIFNILKVLMVGEKFSVTSLTEMGCCNCFGFLSKPQRLVKSIRGSGNPFSQQFLLPDNPEDVDGVLYNGDIMLCGSDDKSQRHNKGFEETFSLRAQSGMICREVSVKETRHVTRTEDENGNKMINEYVRECKIGSGSYGKVVLYRSSIDRKHYALKAFHKSHLLKLRVAPSETAMTDVLREVSIMKMLAHPNIVNLIEVIDGPNTDNFYMVLEYVEGKSCKGSGPPGGIGERTARGYLRDIVAGLMYLHSHEDCRVYFQGLNIGQRALAGVPISRHCL